MRYALPLLCLELAAGPLTGQGATTAAIEGTVTGDDGAPIAGATVRVTNASNGRRWEVATRSAGRYLLEDISVGGPYSIEVRALGFAPVARNGVVLALGARLVADFTLRPVVAELAPVTIAAMLDPVLNPGRTGPAGIASAEQIAARPNLQRDFLALTLMSPHVARSPGSNLTGGSGGITVAGQNRLFNTFQVDGGLNSDPYTGRLPGRNTLPRPVSLEALQELQVLVAPFDVRHGGFAGGLVNAVTRSGTNDLHGSAFAVWSDGVLVGKDAAGDPADGFTTWEYGGTVKGPIARDRAHYFVSLDGQRRFIPDPGPLITDTAGGADVMNVGIRYADAERFRDIIRNTYGLDPGTLGPAHGRASGADVFAKLTVQLGTNSHLELSHHYTDGDLSGVPLREFGRYRLSSVVAQSPATANASRLIWTSLPGGHWSNELILSYLRLRDECRPTATYPLIRVTLAPGLLVAGTPATCPSFFTQDAFEITENLTAGFGDHVLTLGTRLELLRFEDGQLLGGAGLWNFSTLDSLAARLANHYDRTLPGPSRTGVVEFPARQVGVYAQDRWRPARFLTLTAGLRVDIPALPNRVGAYAAADSVLGIDTGHLPTGDVLWSPRLGVNYDVRGEGRTFLRGGIGLFSGHPPYTWLGSAYRDDGLQQLFLECNVAVPLFVDPVNQPTTCANGAGPTPRLSFFDPDVSFPQSLKVSIGVDRRLPGDVVATVDLLYTRAKHQWYFSDANLPPPVGVAEGEGNRPLYGAISLTGVATPARPAPALGQVVRVSGRGGDQSVAVSVQLRKRFADRADVSALYAYTRSRDRMSLTNAQARPNLENTPLDGTLDDRLLRTSYFEIPHRVELAASVQLPYRVRFSLLYNAASGTPYTYSIMGDANADGIGSSIMFNDIAYVPRDRADIALDGNGAAAGVGTLAQQDSVYALLDGFIDTEPCLREQRGRIPERNSCRNPWFGTLNARLTKVIPTIAGQMLELTADVHNVLSLFNRKWGQSRVTTLDPQFPMLQLAAYDASAGRGVYRLPPLDGIRQVQDLASRWQMELSVRYVF